MKNLIYKLLNGPDEIEIDDLIKKPRVRYAEPDPSKFSMSNGDHHRHNLVACKGEVRHYLEGVS
jgi:hypothetical protein